MMRTLLLGILLGFLTRGQSVPVDDVTDVPDKAEVDVLREAITDGFIVDYPFVPTVIDESSKRNSTSHTDVLPDTLHPTSDPEGESTQTTSDEADMMEASTPVEGSADELELEYSSPTPSLLSTLSSSYTTSLQTNNEDLVSSPFPTQSLYPGSSPSAMPGADQGDLFLEETTKSPTTMDYGEGARHPNLQGGKRNSSDALFSSTATNGPKSSISPSHSSVSHNTEVSVHRLDSSLTTLSPSSISSHSPISGSGDENMLDLSPNTSVGTTSSSSLTLSSSSVSGLNSDINTIEDAPTEASTTTLPPGSTTGIVAHINRGLGVEGKVVEVSSMVTPTGGKEQIPTGFVQEVVDPTPSTREGHSTPSWLIILAFVVAVAALVLLCLAIATRDRWNGPNRSCKRKEEDTESDTKADCSNQQRETFLNREKPRENGHAEYTVIPLEELPEKDLLH